MSNLGRLIGVVLPILIAGASSAAGDDQCQLPSGAQSFEFTSDDNRLRGFIDVPSRPGPHLTILIIHGSNDTQVFNPDGEGHHAELREALRDIGVASVVWDRAGSGCSQGTYKSPTPIRERARETVAALDALKRRKDVVAPGLGLWAASEGGWVAPMATVQTDAVSFLILVGTPGRDPVAQQEYQALTELRSSGVSGLQYDTAASHLKLAFAIMRAGGTLEKYEAAVAPLKQFPSLRNAGIVSGTRENYLAWQTNPDFHYRPDTALRLLQQPVLLLFGDRDQLVDWRDSIQIYRDAFRAGHNRQLTVKVVKGADHSLHAQGQSTFDRTAVRTMQQWIKDRLRTE